MRSNLKNYIHLHFIVFIWGFTAVLGKLISIDAMPLVWYRMGIASVIIGLFILFRKYSLKVSKKTFYLLAIAGAALALHWVTFFWAIKVSNVSIALATMSTGALFTALIEPIWYKRKFIWYELIFGLLVVGALFLIFKGDTKYGTGMLIAAVSALMGVVFTLINGQLVTKEKATVIAFYELSIGAILVTLFLAFQYKLDSSLLEISYKDLLFILILASVCTAYAFIGGVHVMKHISPYTVILTVNLEPVYGILMAFFIFGESEKMNSMFYMGAFVILATVIANGILKNKSSVKNRELS